MPLFSVTPPRRVCSAKLIATVFSPAAASPAVDET